uniref:Uncharacterized protein n=1 Tax=Strix occidentalis caurina TaxID=311401 RepID=A0A8D0EIK9_STROC
MSDQMAVIKDTDMSEEMQQVSGVCHFGHRQIYNVEREMTALIKRVNVSL